MLAVSGAAAEEAAVSLAQARVGAGPAGQPQAVARIVHGILGYSRWPASPPVVRICIAGAPRFAGQIGAAAGPGPRTTVRRIAAPAARAEDCDAVYLGSMAAADRVALLGRMRGQAVVTIDEADPQCRAGAMFCLRVARAEVGLDLNLDAVSRSRVRVDPRVLRLSGAVGDPL
ncbi:YfiR family protein [Sphingosinicella sp. LHD-64]|uniref:YfiR family protein n=1 Tax=Sphingosinicella sp. LHD-64 TaxID=3072139 RepID=UPI0028107EFD|nr:YfiR family protein [Sphingosinicella sp. LHD-64]MDQ8756382.1 YfiR family protein [Sphingosinicella sp. LHD-64]